MSDTFRIQDDPAMVGIINRCVDEHFSARLWAKDGTLWTPTPMDVPELTDRLGWLDSLSEMRENIESIQEFAKEVRLAGFTDIALLGMGGSSLCAEVFRRTFKPEGTWPVLHVLDSTDPQAVINLERAVNFEHCLFIVASKSGTTVEPLDLFSYFWATAAARLSRSPGANFVAITDPGSFLAAQAKELDFRRTFLNNPEIGGRFSVLSYFGLVPAALMGVEVDKLLASAEAMAAACGPDVADGENPGLWLGAAWYALNLQGRNKLTVITPPELESFGVWAEQLIAESTGKEGKGIVPISGETLGRPDDYGPDRFFLLLDLKGKTAPTLKAGVDKLEAAGFPVLRLPLRSRTDLGAEFFRFEFATAICGALMEINPFDQPNVQEAKTLTKSLLKSITADQEIEELPDHAGVRGLFVSFSRAALQESIESDVEIRSDHPHTLVKAFLAMARPGDYIGLLTYLEFDDRIERLMRGIQARMRDITKCPVQFGFGPRYLHSTGQLHKGGPNNGLFFVLTADREEDRPIPGRTYTFEQLELAQAIGDFRALEENDRRAMRIHFCGLREEVLRRIRETLG